VSWQPCWRSLLPVLLPPDCRRRRHSRRRQQLLLPAALAVHHVSQWAAACDQHQARAAADRRRRRRPAAAGLRDAPPSVAAMPMTAAACSSLHNRVNVRTNLPRNAHPESAVADQRSTAVPPELLLRDARHNCQTEIARACAARNIRGGGPAIGGAPRRSVPVDVLALSAGAAKPVGGGGGASSPAPIAGGRPLAPRDNVPMLGSARTGLLASSARAALRERTCDLAGTLLLTVASCGSDRRWRS
jgi:hypothetical protein